MPPHSLNSPEEDGAADAQGTARSIARRLRDQIAAAHRAGLTFLAYLLTMAKHAAEKVARNGADR